MVPGIIGKKIGMTHVYDEKGTMVPVTVVQAGPCFVVQVKQQSQDGYNAIQIGYGQVSEKKLTRPVLMHLKKRGLPPLGTLREIRVAANKVSEYTPGQQLTVEAFQPGQYVDVTGTSIGKGFQGVVKRHHFRGGPATHGSMSHRAPGSIGNTAPQRVPRGRKMAGHMGCQKVTVQNLKIVKILPEENCLLLEGAVPGPREGLVLIQPAIKKTRLT